MKTFLANIIIKTTLKFKDKKKYSKGKPSEYKLAKRYKELLITFKRNFKNVVLIIIGIFSASFGFKGFLLTNDFIDGGATGISLLIAAVTGIPLYILIICINIPFIFLGYKIMGKQFAIKGIMSVEDAKRAVDVGATAIMLSNHGGRQLDGSRSPFDQLAEVVDAVGDKIDVICEGELGEELMF